MEMSIEQIFAASPEVRYVAIYRDAGLVSQQRPGLAGASASESDKYEELIVNPALLTLVRQRGNIDCGGAEYVLVRYGNFFEYVQPIDGGHISIGIQPDADPLACIAVLKELLPGRA